MKIEKIVSSARGDFLALDSNGDSYFLTFYICQEEGKNYGKKIFRWVKIEEPDK